MKLKQDMTIANATLWNASYCRCAFGAAALPPRFPTNNDNDTDRQVFVRLADCWIAFSGILIFMSAFCILRAVTSWV